MGESTPNQSLPGTPPSRLKRGRKKVALETLAESSVPMSSTPANGGYRRVRHRTDSGSPPWEAGSSIVPSYDAISHGDFRVFLPNATFVDIRVDGPILKNLKVKTFVELVQTYNEQSKTSETTTRETQWSSGVYIQDFRGDPVEDGGFIKLVDEIKADKGLFLYDSHLDDTLHSHPDFWNITPESSMLASGRPQNYTLFSALADEVDNSLQAVFQLQPGKTRLICVDLDHLNEKIIIYDTGTGMDSSSQCSISKWGTLGASENRHERSEAIGGRPPYLKPKLGMYGLGALRAGLHLGRFISVSSKTEASKRVAILHVDEEMLKTITPGRPWKTPGEFRQPTPKEIELSPHGSFTKVEISKLKGIIPTWKVADVQRKLKDYYFPYIQNDEGSGGTTSTPVEIRVNGINLAEVLGGEVAHTNYYSGNGKPYVLILKLTRNRTTPGAYSQEDDDIQTEANARITCRYFPITQGREAIDSIIEKLVEEDPEFMEVNFEKFPRRSIRRLGRLLPDSQVATPLPFMDVKKSVKSAVNKVNRHCYRRVKAFIDVDAGFSPNETKMDLNQQNDDFSKALLTLGSTGQSRGSGRIAYSEPGSVTVSIQRDGDVIRLKDLSDDYEKWITSQHNEYDTGPLFDESDVFILNNARLRDELDITDEVFQVVYGIKCRGNIDWKVGKDKPPLRLKLERGIPNLNNHDKILHVTVECFISGGFADHPGEARIICRPMEVPEERGSKEIKVDGQDTDFILGESRAFPIEDILFSDKYEKVEEDVWLKRVEKMWSKSPGFVELLNDQEALKLKGHESIPKVSNREAGAALPTEIIAVVRPRLCKHRENLRDSTLEAPRLEQKFIIAEAMEMKLVVRGMKYHSQEVMFSKSAMEEAEFKDEAIISASTIGTLKGLYIFNTKKIESIIKKSGTYFFFFTLVSAKYKDVDDFIVRINVSPSSKLVNWNICSHPGDCIEHHKNQSPEVTKLRLGRVRPRHLYLSRVDEFGNPMKFEEVPSDIACNIYTVEGNQVAISTTISKDSLKITNDKLNLEISVIAGEGNLAPLKPTMQAVLKITIAEVPVASFQISVLPGEVSSARIKESSEAPDNRLYPGQIIEQIVFEVVDKCQNSVSSGQKVKVVLEGFELQDKLGLDRSVDGNGCLDLGTRLRVTSGYGDAARVELRSTEDLSLLEETYTIIKRSLQVKNVPKRIAIGSQLEGLKVEALDENLEVDHGMSGKDHTLTLSWNPGIMVPLFQGRGTLQPIPMPSHEEIWKGCISHTHYPNLQTVVEVEVVNFKSERVEATPTMRAADRFDNAGSPAAIPNIPGLDSPFVPVISTAHLQSLCQASREEVLRLDAKIQRLHTKVIKQNGNLDILKQMQRTYEESNQQFCAEIDSLMVAALETSTINSEGDPVNTPYNRTTERNQVALFDPTMNDNGLGAPYNGHEKYPGILGCTASEVQMQIARLGDPPGTNAATILLEAKHEQHSEIVEDIIGIVALLGAVETEELNRALVEFLGPENMLSIVCRSRSAAEYIGIPSIDRVSDKNKCLCGFGSSRNLKISGRFRVITLTNESSFFKRVDGQPAVDNTHLQKLLNMGPVNERPKGSRGYAVNMIQLNEEQLQTRILGHHGLRESLFFVLFGFLEVFDTTEDMLRAQNDIRSSAVALDGGLIRTSNQFELGSRKDPEVWFPTWIPPVNFEQYSCPTMHARSLVVSPEPLQIITQRKSERPVKNLKRRIKDLEAKMTENKRRYFDENVEARIDMVKKLIQRTEEKLIAVEQQKEEREEKFRSLPEFDVITKLRLEAEAYNSKFDKSRMDNPGPKVEALNQV